MCILSCSLTNLWLESEFHYMRPPLLQSLIYIDYGANFFPLRDEKMVLLLCDHHCALCGFFLLIIYRIIGFDHNKHKNGE
jgi:hypothetical protein